MPPRDPELPEGTDQIVAGSATDDGAGGGFVASGGSNGGGRSETTDRLVNQVRDQVASLRGQAGDKLRTAADDGKSKATDLLDELGGVIRDAAQSIDERLGSEYGDYARQAAEAVSGFSGRIRGKSVDDLLDDTRGVVRRSPGIAIAAAAVAGFALMRVVRTGLAEVGGGRSGGTGTDARTTRSRRPRTSNSDTTTGGGA